MTNNLWKKLCCCFYTSRNKISSEISLNRYYQEIYEYDGNSSHMLCGIIDHLTKESGGNVYDNETVKVTASNLGGCIGLRYAVEFNNFDKSKNEKFFHSSHKEPNSWLMYDFVNRKVNPTGYSIRTRGRCDEYHPRNWVIEGSNDEHYWTILDNIPRNETGLTGIGVTCYFKIERKNKSYRFLRIRQLGTNSNGSYGLLLSALEFFGSLQQ